MDELLQSLPHMKKLHLHSPDRPPPLPAPAVTPPPFFFFKQSLIAFILSRIWRWTAASGDPGGLSLPLGGPVPALPAIYIYKMNLATASHHSSSSHNISLLLPLPSPTHAHSIRCAAFCAVHPSHTHHCSSPFPISHSHCCWGPLSVIMYTSPFIAIGAQFMCADAFGYTGNSCLIPAGVATSVFCNLRPLFTVLPAILSASSFPLIPLCPLTHIKVRGRSCNFSTNPSSIHDLGRSYRRFWMRCITPWLSSATTALFSHAKSTPISSASATVAHSLRYYPFSLVAPAALSSILLPSDHSSTSCSASSRIVTFISFPAEFPPIQRNSVSSSSISRRIGSAISRNSGMCLAYTDAAHRVLLFRNISSISPSPTSACTLSFLLPGYAPTVHLHISYASLRCCSLGSGYSSHPYVKMGSNCCVRIARFPFAGSLLKRRTMSMRLSLFHTCIFGVFAGFALSPPGAFPLSPSSPCASSRASSSSFSPPFLFFLKNH